jgi:hypothetical protein
MKTKNEEYKGFLICPRKRRGFPFYYALIYRVGAKFRQGYVEVQRDAEGGFINADKAIEIAKWEIDQGYYGTARSSHWVGR